MSNKKSKVDADDASIVSTASAVNSDQADADEQSIFGEKNTAEVKDGLANETQANNPLHGVKLQIIVEKLEAEYGWDGLAYRININCFKSEPSVKSSLKFLRRTPWARDKVERLYLKTFHKKYRPESY